MKKFEPAYRLVRVGMATKRERASRQQRTFPQQDRTLVLVQSLTHPRQAAQEQAVDAAWYGKGQGCQGQEGEINDSLRVDVEKVVFFSKRLRAAHKHSWYWICPSVGRVGDCHWHLWAWDLSICQFSMIMDSCLSFRSIDA